MPQRRERYIQVERTRHGRTIYYFRRDARRFRLPDEYGSAEFWAAYRILLSGEVYERKRPAYRKPANSTRLEISKAIRRNLANAKTRAAERGRLFDLTEEWVLEQIDRQHLRCALTDIPFFSTHSIASNTNLFSPSIDRIDSRGGYTRDNVRVIIFALNVMLFDWGEELFQRVANSYRANRLKGVRRRGRHAGHLTAALPPLETALSDESNDLVRLLSGAPGVSHDTAHDMEPAECSHG